MPQLRASLILLGFLILTLPLMPVQFCLRFTPGHAMLPRHYHRLLCLLLGLTVDVQGSPPSQAALLVANHVSWLDIPILGSILPLSFIAKREVGTWPFFSWLARLQNCVFVNRESRRSTGVSAIEISHRIRAGDTLVLFPEGTSSKGTMLLPFKSSFFSVAEQIAAPVIPVTLSYQAARNLPLTNRQRPRYAWYGDMDLLPHLWGALKAGPLRVEVTFDAPLVHGPRKVMARAAEAVITQRLAETLHAGAKMR